jgi:chorismate synthase
MQGIDAGVPTDRLLLEWFLLDQRVEERANGLPANQGFPDASLALTVDDLRPTDPLFGLDSDRILIPLPPNFIKLSKSNPEIALDWRLKTRELFLHYFGRGYQISDFTQVGGPAYLLERKVGNES